MRLLRLALFYTFAATTLVSNAAFAAAFQLYELGTPVIGTADVGQAVTEDASASYFNPAAMTLLQDSQFMLGTQALISYLNFSKNTSTTISGDNGGNAGAIVPGFDVFYVYNYSPALRFGLNIASPYGGELNYTDGWVGRYSVQQAFFFAVDINPSIGYRINRWLSMGAGATLEYLTFQQTVALPLVKDVVDGQIKVSLADFAPGFNVGVMLTPYTSTRIGLTYRSQLVHHLHGNSIFLRIDTQPNTTTSMVMPSNAILSVAQDISNQFTVLGELGWADWSSMRNSIVNVANYTALTPLNWNNTYRYGLGVQFKFNPCFMLQMGGSYDSSPTTASKRLPVLAMDRQVRLGAGITYLIIKNVTLGASYEYINFGRATIQNTSSLGVLSGSYSRNYANTLQLSLNVAT